MRAPLTFSLNRTCAPGRDLDGFVTLASGAGVTAVEIRNDVGAHMSGTLSHVAAALQPAFDAGR